MSDRTGEDVPDTSWCWTPAMAIAVFELAKDEEGPDAAALAAYAVAGLYFEDGDTLRGHEWVGVGRGLEGGE